MFLLRAIWVFFFSCTLFPSLAVAYCSEPIFWANEPDFAEMAPDPPRSYAKPDVPYCLSSYSYSGSHTCERYEIDRYFDEVEEYVSDLSDYYSEVLQFVERAREYAERAVDFASEVEAFSNEVFSYAKCEADDAQTQHE
jgi:hypothetical protein